MTYRGYLDLINPLKQPNEIADSAERRKVNAPIEEIRNEKFT